MQDRLFRRPRMRNSIHVYDFSILVFMQAISFFSICISFVALQTLRVSSYGLGTKACIISNCLRVCMKVLCSEDIKDAIKGSSKCEKFPRPRHNCPFDLD